MAIRNMMESIVSEVVDEIIHNDKDVSLDNAGREDVIAYVLNRIPSRYVTSERGVIHNALENRYTPQKRADILVLIYDAFKVIKSRRETEVSGSGKPVHVSQFPHVMGEVLEESTFSVVPDVTVTLLYNEKKASMVDSDWKNPYATHRATKGYYHFWPEYSETEMGKSKAHKFILKLSHPKFEEKIVELELGLLSNSETEKLKMVPIVLLKAKEGVDLSFLYDE